MAQKHLQTFHSSALGREQQGCCALVVFLYLRPSTRFYKCAHVVRQRHGHSQMQRSDTTRARRACAAGGEMIASVKGGVIPSCAVGCSQHNCILWAMNRITNARAISCSLTRTCHCIYRHA